MAISNEARPLASGPGTTKKKEKAESPEVSHPFLGHTPISCGARVVAQLAKGIAAKPEDLSFISRTHMVDREANPRKLCSNGHMTTCLHTCAHTHTPYIYIHIK